MSDSMEEMTPERWRQIEELFYAALNCQPHLRSEFLARSCCGDQRLREMVESLLVLSEEASDFIEAPAVATVFGELSPTTGLDDRLGLATSSTTLRFQRLLALGAGVNGTVYKVLDREDGNIVALKHLSHTQAGKRESFVAQFSTLAEIHHANLIQLYDLFVDSQDCYFTMPLVAGSDLISYLHNSGIAQLRTLLKQLAQALIALHSNGWLHSNIKPTNLLVDAHGHLIITDCGLNPEIIPAPFYQRSGYDETIAYISPELCAGKKASAASDWYSVGAILYQILTGNRPFTGSTWEIIMNKRRFILPPPSLLRPDIDTELDRLCHSLLNPDPTLRMDESEIKKILVA
ncbi:MAG: serine/threonine-protein kinase [Acidobacteriota bacterium]